MFHVEGAGLRLKEAAPVSRLQVRVQEPEYIRKNLSLNSLEVSVRARPAGESSCNGQGKKFPSPPSFLFPPSLPPSALSFQTWHRGPVRTRSVSFYLWWVQRPVPANETSV